MMGEPGNDPAPIRQVVVVAKSGAPGGRRIAAGLAEWLEGRGIDVTFDMKTATEVGRLGGVPRNELPVDVDLAIVAGGDGTLLSVARWAAPLKLPITKRTLVIGGGIGGIHRGHPEDVSADLPALSTTPITVVCAGAKAILDLERTLERLETLGVEVVGYGTDTFPAFTSPSSGLPVPARADTPDEVAAIAQARDALGLSAAVLVCAPIPAEAALDWDEANAEIEAAVAAAEAQRIGGKELTPFLLARLSTQTGGRSLAANQALLLNNSRIAARIASALCTTAQRPAAQGEPNAQDH